MRPWCFPKRHYIPLVRISYFGNIIQSILIRLKNISSIFQPIYWVDVVYVETSRWSADQSVVRMMIIIENSQDYMLLLWILDYSLHYLTTDKSPDRHDISTNMTPNTIECWKKYSTWYKQQQQSFWLLISQY